MKFAIAFVAALASLATLNSAQDTVDDVACMRASLQLSLKPGLTNKAQNIDVGFKGVSYSCTLGKALADPSWLDSMADVRITGKSSGSCRSDSAAGDAKSTGFPSFSGTAVIEVRTIEGGVISDTILITFSGLVNGKITTGGIELEGKITKGEGKGKIIRIRGKGTSEDERKKESAKCNSWSGYYRIYGDLDTISITDN
ncbi:hypothetical protein GQ42DRAFT_172152 [Ramicandelaber brevisporus]|nr:hypothetical protein GQ42DRAFT_172152 [Ramicandelaber brevisporus]